MNNVCNSLQEALVSTELKHKTDLVMARDLSIYAGSMHHTMVDLGNQGQGQC